MKKRMKFACMNNNINKILTQNVEEYVTRNIDIHEMITT